MNKKQAIETNLSETQVDGKKMPKFQRYIDQAMWFGVYCASAAFAFYFILALINASFSTGIYWKVGESRFKAYRHHSVQYQLFNSTKLKDAEVIIVGDTPFIDQIKKTDYGNNSEQINVPSMSLVNLMITLTALENSEKKADRIILFNAPWQWSSASASLTGGAQDMSFYNRVGKFNMKRDKMKLALIFLEQFIKRPTTPYTDDQFTRPKQFTNVNFEYPPISPTKKIYHNNVMRMLGKYEEVIWVNDPSAVPKNTSQAFLTDWSENLSAGSEFLEVGVVNDMPGLDK